MVTAPKDALKSYLNGARDVLLWKLGGLSERDLRLPRTPTGTNLLGIVKHALNTEVLYFGPTFAREWPTPDELVSPNDPDPLIGWYATETETASGIVDLYRRVQIFADETIDALPLDAIGPRRPLGWRGGHAPRDHGPQDRRPAAPRGPRRHSPRATRWLRRPAAGPQQHPRRR